VVPGKQKKRFKLYVKVNSFGKTKKTFIGSLTGYSKKFSPSMSGKAAKRSGGDSVCADLQDDDAVSPFPQMQSVPGSGPTRKRTFRSFLQ
jgi:hypothetical protein